MAWGISNNISTAIGREKSVGNIDGNALFALCFKAINKKGKVDFFALGAIALGFSFKGF